MAKSLDTGLERKLKTTTALPTMGFAALGLAGLLMGTAPAALAQEEVLDEPIDPETGMQLAEVDTDTETMEVTGSRINRPALDLAAPITTISEQEFSRGGQVSIIEYLNDIPALVGSDDNDDTTGLGLTGTGFNTLNLRNLGTNRTLVLVNGRRHVGGNGGSVAVDINTIPQSLIERVDVLTGGASSIYGADAVTGAVNFVLKDDFEGLVINGFGGLTTDEGDAASYRFDATAGKNFHGGRGNITASFQYQKENGINIQDRDFARAPNFASLLNNPGFQPDAAADNFDPRQRIFVQDATIRFAGPEGSVAVDFFDGFDLLFDFEGDGDPFDPGEVIQFRNAIGGSTTRIADFTESITSDVESYIFNTTGRYDFHEKVRGYFEVKFAQVEAQSVESPAFSDLVPISVNENPFVPDEIRDAANAAGAETVFISHDLFEVGRRGQDNRRRTYRVVAGLEGSLFDSVLENFDYDLSYVYGRTDTRLVSSNNLVLDRFYAAVDAVVDPATGQPTCRTNLDPTALPPQIPFPGGFGFLGFFDAFNTTVTPDNFGTTPFFTPGPDSGCAPLNIFGLGNSSPEARAFVNDQSIREATIEQHVVTLAFSGDTAGVFELPGGPIAFAFGGEYREESSEDTPPVINLEGLTFGNEIRPTVGDFDVYEGFAEVSLPLLADLPFIHELTFDGSVRLSDYSTVGSTTAYSYGGIWSPVPDIRFRGTRSVAVRAPNIAELFNPQNQSFFLPDDPCDIDNLNLAANPGLRAQNCAAILEPLGVDPATFQGDDILNATFEGLLGGNPDLMEETARSYTVGVVVQPRWIENLTLTVDYFDINIEDGIIAPASQDIVDQCVDLPSINNPFCDLIQRRADGGLSFLEVVPVNVAFFETKGVDWDLNYLFDPSMVGLPNIGTFNFRFFGNYLRSLDVVSLPGQEPDQEKDETETLLGDDAPEITVGLGLTWFYKNVLANYNWRYRDRLFRDEVDEFESAANQGLILFEPGQTSALSTHDIQLRYLYEDHAEFYVGVNNITDQEPDIGSIATPVSAVGRYVYGGFTLRFQ